MNLFFRYSSLPQVCFWNKPDHSENTKISKGGPALLKGKLKDPSYIMQLMRAYIPPINATLSFVDLTSGSIQ